MLKKIWKTILINHFVVLPIMIVPNAFFGIDGLDMSIENFPGWK